MFEKFQDFPNLLLSCPFRPVAWGRPAHASFIYPSFFSRVDQLSICMYVTTLLFEYDVIKHIILFQKELAHDIGLER